MNNTTCNKISIVIVKIDGCADYIHSAEQWKQIGGYRGFIKQGGISISQITGLEYSSMNVKEFNDLPAWEG